MRKATIERAVAKIARATAIRKGFASASDWLKTDDGERLPG
jgi:hypothetical protein